MTKYNERPSPPFSASEHKNEVKIGNDGNNYVSRANKNNIFRWYIIEECNTAEKYYMQFPKYYLDKKFIKFNLKETETKLKKIKNILKKNNIYLFKIGWKNIGSFIDYAWMDAREIIIEKYGKQKYFKDIVEKIRKDNSIDKKKTDYDILRKNFYNIFNLIFYTDNRSFFSLNNGDLELQWNLDKNSKDIVTDILRKEFKKKYIIPKSINKSIIIKLNKL
jgi:hypothetical protein